MIPTPIVRRAGACAALVSFLGLCGMARGQAVPTSGGDETPSRMDAVIVTGSNLPNTAGASSVPVASVGAQDMADSGVSTDLLSMLRKALPQFAGNGNIGIDNAGGQAFFTMGGSQLSIHNLSTLVLINGRRVAFDPAEAAIGGEFVDINMIPPSAVERIEVVSDGASAIYGSDAVGGVVNVILKSNFSGWEAGVHWGESDNPGHYTERSGYLSGGYSRPGSSLMISVEGTEFSPVYESSRPYSSQIYGSTSYPGLIDLVNFQNGSDQYYKLNPSLNAPPGGAQYTIDQLVQNGTYIPLTYQQVFGGYNMAGQQTLTESLKRRSFVADLDQQLAGERLELFGDLILATTHTQSSVSAQSLSPYVSTPVTDYAEYGTTPPPPGAYGFLPYVPAATASNPFDPNWISQGYLVTVHDKFEQYPLLTQDSSSFFRIVAGLKGKIGANYSWEAAYNFSRYHVEYTSPGQVDTAALNAALAAGSVNPFAYTQSGALPAGVIGTKSDDMFSILSSFDALLRGTPFELPSGAVSFALGASFTREHLTGSPDANSVPNAESIPAWLSYQSLSPFDASRNVESVFGEVKIPLVGPAQNLPGAHSVTLDLTARYDDYTLVGHSAVPGVSLAWQPVDSLFSFRVSAERSFAAPQLYDLYGPVQYGQNPPITFNNYGGGVTQQAVFNGFSGPNTDLSPAKANTWSAGFVLTPKSVKGLTLSADYFEAFDKDEIGYLSVPAIVQSTELFGTASPFARFVHFGSPAGPSVTGPGQLSTSNPSTVYIEVPVINLASQTIKGFDASLSYSVTTETAGRFDLTSNLTVFNSYLVQAIPTENYYQYAGDVSGGASSAQGTIPKWRTHTTLEWTRKGVDVVVAQTLIPKVTDIGPGGDAASAPVSVASYQQYDVIVGYDLSRNRALSWAGKLNLRVGVDNAFNRMPPLAPNANPNTNADVGTYGGAIGRLWFVDAQYRF